jgi:hypothetical protein
MKAALSQAEATGAEVQAETMKQKIATISFFMQRKLYPMRV